MLLKSKKKFLFNLAPFYASVSAGLPTLTYIGAVTPTNVGQIATATSVSIGGSPSADRLVVVVFEDNNTNSTDFPTTLVTIQGITATLNTSASGVFNPVVGIASVIVPTGTTATIVVTYAGTNAPGGGNFQIYTISGLSSTTPTGTGQTWDNGTNPLTTSTFTTSSGGVVIAGAIQYAVFNTVSFSSTSGSITTDLNNGSGGFDTIGSASVTGTSASGSASVTATWTSTNSHTAIAAVAWR